MLVNNVERFDAGKGKIHKQTDAELVETTNANTFPMVMMTRFLGPKMKARGTGKSGIINMTSYYVDWPTFNLPLYCAGKSLQAQTSYVFGLEVEDEMDVVTVK